MGSAASESALSQSSTEHRPAPPFLYDFQSTFDLSLSTTPIATMSLNIPASPATADGQYQSRPAEYSSAVEKALGLFKEHMADESSWEELPEKDDVKLARKATSEDPYDIPLVKGVTTVENATPSEVLATIQLPGLRKKW